MRSLSLIGITAALLLTSAPLAAAQPQNQISDAIALCRTTVAEQAGVDREHARLDRAAQHGRTIRVDVDLWRNGSLTNVRCDVSRGDTLTVASISPALATATAAR